MSAKAIGPVAILALAALALWWLYRRGLRPGSRRLAAPPLQFDTAQGGVEMEPVTIDPGFFRMPHLPPIRLH